MQPPPLPTTNATLPSGRDRARRRLVGAALLALVACTRPAPAQTPPADPNDRHAAVRAELDAVLKDIALGRERQAAVAAEIEKLMGDRAALSAELVEVGDRIREAEGRLAVTEKRIADLDRDVANARKALDARRDVLADVLAALQRMGRQPPPAIAVHPADALAAVRGAILMGAVLPDLRDRAEALAADLQALEQLEAKASGERERFRAEGTELVAERERLRLLVEQRRKTQSEREAGLEAERRRVAELAEKAASLRELVASLERAGITGPTTDLAAARGRLPLPVAGDTVLKFGESDGTGTATRGQSIATRTGASVTSPCDGTVLFAGPFRSYGKLLIINGGGGYHVVLAGMERIDVETGQTVLAGEPVGLMGARPGSVVGGGSAADRPVLYVEFRKDGTSIDPSPWWGKARDEKVRG